MTVRGRLVGMTGGISGTLIFVYALLPFREHVAVATITLIFIIPVIVGVVFGGLASGLAHQW